MSNELKEKILTILESNGGLKAREIALELDLDRREVNQFLYENRGTLVESDDNHCWYLKGLSSASIELPATATRASTSDAHTPDSVDIGKKWRFIPQLPGYVETEVTQRDQFKNDDVDLADTIVREAIQNSLDAAIVDGGQVEVSFRWLNAEDGLSQSFVSSLFDGQLEHAESSGIEIDEVDFSSPTALVIEDFGTKGLTGSITQKDDDNFSDFWRRHGKSHKTGKSRGRWGLGKLVYSTASQLSAFFGATLRDGDAEVHVMGQTVLGLRRVDGREYPPHAFFADIEGGDDLYTQIQVPLKDKALAKRISDQFQLRRLNRTGLSVVIPFPTADLRKEKMIGVAIENYFYPLLTGHLVMSFDDIELNADNVRTLAHQYASNSFQDIDTLFDFIVEISELADADHLQLIESWADDEVLDESDFAEADIEQVRRKFANGELVALKLPVSLKKKNGVQVGTSFKVYIKRPDNLARGSDLYVRGGLTLPQEAKFRDRRALGAMIADQDAICAFLGDAENAAHTKWIANSEKLRNNYRNPRPTLKVIKFALLHLYDMLAEVSEEIDEQALSSFFWVNEPDGSSRKRKPSKTPIVIPDPPEPKPKPFYINQTSGGFTVGSTEHATADKLPISLRITAAYDVGTGNPFKKYSPHDFKIGSNSPISVAITKETANIVANKENQIDLEVTGTPFKIKVTGFDPNRDLKVKLASGV